MKRFSFALLMSLAFNLPAHAHAGHGAETAEYSLLHLFGELAHMPFAVSLLISLALFSFGLHSYLTKTNQ